MNNLRKVTQDWTHADQFLDEKIERTNVTFGDYYTKAEVDKMVGKWTVKKSTFTSTAANTLEYTGLSVVIPANTAMLISVLNQYMNSPATSTVISFSSDTATGYNVVASGIVSVSSIYNNNTDSARTLYIWSAHEAANANPVIVSYKPV